MRLSWDDFIGCAGNVCIGIVGRRDAGFCTAGAGSVLFECLVRWWLADLGAVPKKKKLILELRFETGLAEIGRNLRTEILRNR